MSAKSQSKSGFSFLVQASKFYCDLCPEQSRFFMQKSQNMSSGVKRVIPEELFCSYCFQWRQPANHRMRPRPRRSASARVQSVLRREGRGKRLSMPQRDLLRRYRNAPSYLMATCHTCNKTSKYSGVNRDMLASVSRTHSHTPGSAAKRKTPQSSNRSNIATPKSVSKEKTPSSTPRSNSTASTSSTPASKPSSTKKSVFSRLRKFLLLDDSQKKKTKGGLKDFLSSL